MGGLGLGIGLYFSRYLKKIMIWFKNGIEDSDGKVSQKDLQFLIFTILAVFVVLTIGIFGAVYPDALIYSVFLAATGMYVGKEYFDKKK